MKIIQILNLQMKLEKVLYEFIVHKNTREITNYNESKAELYKKKCCEEEEVYEEDYDEEKDFQNEIKLID